MQFRDHAFTLGLVNFRAVHARQTRTPLAGKLIQGIDSSQLTNHRRLWGTVGWHICFDAIAQAS